MSYGSIAQIAAGPSATDLNSLSEPSTTTTILEEQGSGVLEHGTAEIKISQKLKQQIEQRGMDHNFQIHIFLEGDSKGVFVTKQNAEAFFVKELMNGASNAAFTWHMIATPSKPNPKLAPIITKLEIQKEEIKMIL